MNNNREAKIIEGLVDVILGLVDDVELAESMLRNAGMSEEEINKALY
jgi:hypothetical protein